MNYEIYEKDGARRVLFEDGTDYFIHTDENGKEYFSVPNMLNNPNDGDPFSKLFNGRIKDAIDTIKCGDADAVLVRTLFGKTEDAVRFVDRNHGEYVRSMTIEGYKDSVFGYALKYNQLNSFNGGSFVSKDKKTNGNAFFETLEEAEDFKRSILEELEELSIKYVSIKGDKFKVDAFMKEIEFDDVAVCMLSLEEKGDKWLLDIVQTIKPIEVNENAYEYEPNGKPGTYVKVIRNGINDISYFAFLKKDDIVFSNGAEVTLECDAHYSGDASLECYLFYGTDGESYFPEDVEYNK